MAGASESTLRVQNVNLNWASTAQDATVEALVVTEDDVRHTLPVPATALAGFIAMIAASPVLLFDPTDARLIACNLVGKWLPEDWSGLPVR